MISLDKKYLTVTALTKYLKFKFDHDVHLNQVLLKGEISNFKHHSRGHFYFTIKDDNAQIQAVMFQTYASKCDFIPKDGQMVLITGKVLIYEAGGNYQINVTSMSALGLGDLYLAYEKLKKELALLGFFNPEHKLPIPKYPKRIGVITSKTGAAVRDIINTITRRYPICEVYLYPCLVQGEMAKESIVTAINKANDDNIVDVIILGRGGGSIEDLWAFNERIVAEAIYQSHIPIISAVGHEIDFTIADYVSDLRAPTPTAGAELATPNKLDVIDYILILKSKIEKIIVSLIDSYHVSLVNLDQRLENRNPSHILEEYKEKILANRSYLSLLMNNLLDSSKSRLDLAKKGLIFHNPSDLIIKYQDQIKNKENKLTNDYQLILNSISLKYNVLISKLEALNPLGLMKKGYSIAYKDDKIISSVDDCNINDNISLNVSDGQIDCLVLGGKKNA